MKNNQLHACLEAWYVTYYLKKSYPGIDWDVKAKHISLNLRGLHSYANLDEEEFNKHKCAHTICTKFLIPVTLAIMINAVIWYGVCNEYGGCDRYAAADHGPLIITHDKAMYVHSATFAFVVLIVASIDFCCKRYSAPEVLDRKRAIATLSNDLLTQKEYHLFKDFARYLDQQNLGSVGRVVGEYTDYSKIVSQLELRCDITLVNKIQTQLYNAIYHVEALCYFNASQSNNSPFASAWLPPEVWKLIMNQILFTVEAVFPDISLNSKIYLASLIRATNSDPVMVFRDCAMAR